MSDTDRWLERATARALALCSAYRRQLDGLWWLNLMFVVTPAVGTAAAAVVAALPDAPPVFLGSFSIPLASVLAGGSAVLMAVHKSLGCEEYQEECLRISQAYESLAVRLESARSAPEDVREAQRVLLTNKLAVLSKNVKAKLPRQHRAWAETRYGETSAVPI